MDFYFTGPNWNRGDEDGGPETTGTVIRKHRNNKVSVSTGNCYTNLSLSLSLFCTETKILSQRKCRENDD